MSSHLDQLQSRRKISDRIAYLKRNPSLIDGLSEEDRAKVINFLRTRLESPNMGFESTEDSRKARGFGDLASLVQEMLTSASREEIKKIAKKLGLMS